jgi:hypothetical protein|tara:strand:- start:315 stop:899 length:585 start_codon:yes stop_codon:yes gene_type:complete
MKYVPVSTINRQPQNTVWVVDNFYADPYAVRDYALRQEFKAEIKYFKGSRSIEQFFVPGTKEAFERIMGIKIREWESHGMCGRFQYCTSQDPIVYHNDGQTWAAMIYLNPDAPYSTGTSLYAHKNGARRTGDPNFSDQIYSGGFFDRTKFELVDSIGNVFNRLFIFDAQNIHAASEYFGQTKEDSRLFHIFFFD